MDIAATKVFAGNSLKFKICRYLQMGVDLISVVTCAAALATSVLACRKSGLEAYFLGKQCIWIVIMFFVLIHSTSGAILYLIKRKCSSEESWKILYVACNICTSMIIQFGSLLGSQPLPTGGILNHMTICKPLSPQHLLKKHTNDVDLLKSVPTVLAVAEAICQVASIVHFIAAFYPPPMYLVEVDSTTSSQEALHKNSLPADVDADALPSNAEASDSGDTEEETSPPDQQPNEPNNSDPPEDPKT